MSASLLLLLAGQGFTVFETHPTTDYITTTVYSTYYETTYDTNKATDTVYLTNHNTNTYKNTVTLFDTLTVFGTNRSTSRSTNFSTNTQFITEFPTYFMVQTSRSTDVTYNYSQQTSETVGGPIFGDQNVRGQGFDDYNFVIQLYLQYFLRYPEQAGLDWWYNAIVTPYGQYYAELGGGPGGVDGFIGFTEQRFYTTYWSQVIPQNTYWDTEYVQQTSRLTDRFTDTYWTTVFETFYSNDTSRLTGTSRNTDTIYETNTIYNTNKSTTTIYTTTIGTDHITNHDTTTVWVTNFTTQRFTGIDNKTSEGFNEQP